MGPDWEMGFKFLVSDVDLKRVILLCYGMACYNITSLIF